MYYTVKGRGASALNGKLSFSNFRLSQPTPDNYAAQEQTYDDVQYSIPPNQWQIEVSLWFSTCLAKEQQWAVEWATAPTYINFAAQKNISGSWKPSPLTDAAAKQQCQQQMVQSSGGYQSFSVLGIALILALGGLIIVMGLTVDMVAGKFGPESSKFKNEQWDNEETLALLRTVYVASGMGRDGFAARLPPITALSRGESTKDLIEDAGVMELDDYYIAQGGMTAQ
jgi:hypothetical protein